MLRSPSLSSSSLDHTPIRPFIHPQQQERYRRAHAALEQQKKDLDKLEKDQAEKK